MKTQVDAEYQHKLQLLIQNLNKRTPSQQTHPWEGDTSSRVHREKEHARNDTTTISPVYCEHTKQSNKRPHDAHQQQYRPEWNCSVASEHQKTDLMYRHNLLSFLEREEANERRSKRAHNTPTTSTRPISQARRSPPSSSKHGVYSQPSSSSLGAHQPPNPSPSSETPRVREGNEAPDSTERSHAKRTGGVGTVVDGGAAPTHDVEEEGGAAESCIPPGRTEPAPTHIASSCPEGPVSSSSNAPLYYGKRTTTPYTSKQQSSSSTTPTPKQGLSSCTSPSCNIVHLQTYEEINRAATLVAAVHVEAVVVDVLAQQKRKQKAKRMKEKSVAEDPEAQVRESDEAPESAERNHAKRTGTVDDGPNTTLAGSQPPKKGSVRVPQPPAAAPSSTSSPTPGGAHDGHDPRHERRENREKFLIPSASNPNLFVQPAYHLCPCCAGKITCAKPVSYAFIVPQRNRRNKNTKKPFRRGQQMGKATDLKQVSQDPPTQDTVPTESKGTNRTTTTTTTPRGMVIPPRKVEYYQQRLSGVVQGNQYKASSSTPGHTPTPTHDDDMLNQPPPQYGPTRTALKPSRPQTAPIRRPNNNAQQQQQQHAAMKTEEGGAASTSEQHLEWAELNKDSQEGGEEGQGPSTDVQQQHHWQDNFRRTSSTGGTKTTNAISSGSSIRQNTMTGARPSVPAEPQASSCSSHVIKTDKTNNAPVSVPPLHLQRSSTSPLPRGSSVAQSCSPKRTAASFSGSPSRAVEKHNSNDVNNFQSTDPSLEDLV